MDKGNDYVNVIFRFDCRVTGRPYPEVTWYINGQQVANDLTHKILVNESGNNSLMITNVSRADAGVVTCVARNKAGETSFQCNLNVIEKEQVVAPKFVERFTTTNVKEGEPVVFMARAVGTPVPRITWQKVWWKFYEIKLRIIYILINREWNLYLYFLNTFELNKDIFIEILMFYTLIKIEFWLIWIFDPIKSSVSYILFSLYEISFNF